MSDTGHKKELGDASTKLAEAITAGDLAALRQAASDHATALNSQATAMAASIAAPLYTQMGDIATQIRQLAEIVTNARQADLSWRTDERIQRDDQHDQLYKELDRLFIAVEESGARLGKLERNTEEMDTRHSGQWGTAMDLLAESKADRVDLRQRIDAIAALADERGRLLDEHVTLMREVAELKAWRDAQERGGDGA
jgi:DNA repair exonuclease SbcCD ATPase subunit